MSGYRDNKECLYARISDLEEENEKLKKPSVVTRLKNTQVLRIICDVVDEYIVAIVIVFLTLSCIGGAVFLGYRSDKRKIAIRAEAAEICKKRFPNNKHYRVSEHETDYRCSFFNWDNNSKEWKESRKMIMRFELKDRK